MEHLADFGLRITSAIAGFCGGVTYVFVTKNTKPFEAIGSVVVGSLTANYLGTHVANLTSLAEAPAGFVTGLCAMAMCQGIIAGGRRFRLSEKGDENV